jgi:hypothetical protein
MTIDAPPEPTIAPSPRVAGRFGIARRDVTPPEDIYFRNWGAATRDTANGVHRPFYAVAMTMREAASDDPLVLVGLDGGWWQASADEWFVRSAVVEGLALDPSHVMINLSHTHAGPSLVLENADRPGGHRIRPYLETLRREIVAAAKDALANEREGELRWAVGRSDVATNRSRPDPAGRRFVTGYNPNGRADDTVLVGRLSDASGAVLGTIVNYACHPTTLAWDNELLSPDYVGAARETMEEATGGAPCLFLLGACGELAPAHQYVGDVAVADAHGHRLGLAAHAALASMPEPGHDLVFDRIVESGAPLAVWLPRPTERGSTGVAATRLVLDLPIKADYPSMEQILAELAVATEGYQVERLNRKARLRRSLGDEATYPFSTWVWRVGETIFVGWPGEAFSLIQETLRSAYPDLTIVVMNVVNGTIGYLPPAELYDEDMYEVWQTPLDRGCLESLMRACTDAIDRLVTSA